jgi:hypothetical protein
LEYKKLKAMGLPVPAPKPKKINAKPLPPNPVKEALKDEEERKADELIKALELEAAEKKASADAA